MRKVLVVFLLLVLMASFVFGEQIVLKGEENRSQLQGAKSISVFLTYNGTKIYDSLIDDYIVGIKEEGFTLIRDDIIADYIAEVEKNLDRMGKKWGMNLVNKKSSAKKGFLFVVNYNSLVPIPAIGYHGHAVVTVYKSSDLKKSILKFEIKTFTMMGLWPPRFSFPKNGFYFVQEIAAFMRKTK